MRDVQRRCECGKDHPWGVVRYSQDNTPLYGPRAIATCDDFRPEQEKVPAFVEDLRELWSQTGDLDPQATVATRAVIARIRTLPDPREQWAEFAGLLVSQVTTVRAALTRDESKFAHLVAHTDEIVSAMENVVQLADRLKAQDRKLNAILEELETVKVAREAKERPAELEALQHFGLDELAFKDETGAPFQVVPPNTILHDSRTPWSPSLPSEAVLVERDDNNDDDNDQTEDEQQQDDDKDPEEQQ